MRIADYAIVGNMEYIVPALTQQLIAKKIIADYNAMKKHKPSRCKSMKLLKLSIKFITLSLIIPISLLLSSLIYANEVNTDLEKICDRESIIIAAKLRSNSKNELTAQDMSMIRIGAINGCIETYKRMHNSNDFVKSNSSDQTVAAKSEVKEKQEKDGNNKKKSIFDRLLRTEPKEDVNPMQKKHRTGGK